MLGTRTGEPCKVLRYERESKCLPILFGDYVE